MSLDDYSQQPFSPPTLLTLPYFDDFENPQHIYEYPAQYSMSTAPSSQLSFDTTIQSSPTPESSTSTDNKPLRNRTCQVYKHMPDIDIGTKYYSTTNKLEQRYKYCTKRYTVNRGTRLIKVYLKVDHDISKLLARQERSIKR